ASFVSMLPAQPSYNRTRLTALAWRARSLSQKALPITLSSARRFLHEPVAGSVLGVQLGARPLIDSRSTCANSARGRGDPPPGLTTGGYEGPNQRREVSRRSHRLPRACRLHGPAGKHRRAHGLARSALGQARTTQP